MSLCSIIKIKSPPPVEIGKIECSVHLYNSLCLDGPLVVDFGSLAKPLVYTAIMFAECKPTERQLYFERVSSWFLKDDSSSVKARDWINDSMKQFQLDPVQVLPLVQYFVKVLEKRQETVITDSNAGPKPEAIITDFRKGNAMKSREPFELNKVPHDLRLPALYNMLEFRNSLMIMNRLKNLGLSYPRTALQTYPASDP